MKRKNYIYFLPIIVISLLLNSCANPQKTVVGTPISFSQIPMSVSNNSFEYAIFNHLNEIRNVYRLDRTVVIRGTKEGLSTPVQTYEEDGSEGMGYCETKIRVSEVYYGDLKPGDLITHKEFIRIMETNNGPLLLYPEDMPPIEENEPYILILSKNSQISSDGSVFYGTYSMHHSHHKISDYQDFKQKVENGTATAREIFGYEVLDYYLNEPDTRLDLYREASQYVENLSETASQEEILAALPEEQRVLFTRLIAQYGVKS